MKRFPDLLIREYSIVLRVEFSKDWLNAHDKQNIFTFLENGWFLLPKSPCYAKVTLAFI